MGLSETEYRRLSPAEFKALFDRYKIDQSYADLRTGVIGAAVWNSALVICRMWGAEVTPDVTPASFRLPFLSMGTEPAKKKGPAAAEYEEYLHMKRLKKMMGGKAKR